MGPVVPRNRQRSPQFAGLEKSHRKIRRTSSNLINMHAWYRAEANNCRLVQSESDNAWPHVQVSSAEKDEDVSCRWELKDEVTALSDVIGSLPRSKGKRCQTNCVSLLMPEHSCGMSRWMCVSQEVWSESRRCEMRVSSRTSQYSKRERQLTVCNCNMAKTWVEYSAHASMTQLVPTQVFCAAFVRVSHLVASPRASSGSALPDQPTSHLHLMIPLFASLS